MIKLKISLIFLILLSGCSFLADTQKTVANASEEIQQGQVLPITATAEMAGKTIQLEVAQTPEQQAIGLMYRKSLADDRGMLFPFAQERIASFWMKNVSISLDMIFLNGNQIVSIAADVPPCKAEPCPIYGPGALVNKVIELRGGRAKELGIKAGDKIMIRKSDS